jgi:MFS family permease
LADKLTLQWTLCAMLGGAAVLGAIDYFILMPLPDPNPEPINTELKLLEVLREPLADANFRRYLGFGATLTLGVGYVGQYIWLFFLDVVRYSNSKATFLLISAPLVVAMLCVPLWGKVIDRFGRRPTMILTGLLVLHGAAVWMLLATPFVGLAVGLAVIVMIAWPGLDLGSLNLMFGLSTMPGTRRQNSSYTAVASVVFATAGVVSGLFGAAVAKLLGDWHGSLFGVPVTYHGVLFIISGVLRLLSLLWLIPLKDEGSSTVAETARGVAAGIVHAIVRGFTFPRRKLAPPLTRGAQYVMDRVRQGREERARRAA